MSERYNENMFAEELENLIQEIQADPENRKYTKRKIPPVFQIHEHARILIIGQAPGRKVEETLIPFNDASGKRLMEWLGMTQEEFYGEKAAILPMDFYYPGKGKTGDLPPRKCIAEKYHERLRSLMPEITLTVLIGSYACQYYLKDIMHENLTETVKAYEEYLPAYFPIVHPSPLNAHWLKKNSWFEEKTVPALQIEVQRALNKS